VSYDDPPMASPVGRYLNETRRPIYSAALVLPFFLVYHTGTFFLSTTYINGADALIMQLLSLLSVRSALASALVLLLAFVIWQVRTGASWKVVPSKLAGMFAESVLFAIVLYAGFGWLASSLSLSAGGRDSAGLLERVVLYCGAGIYEELVFRGFLLGALIWFLTRVTGLKRGAAAFWGALAAALLFSAFHYLGPAGDAFTLPSFTQRALGGLYFSCLFVTRGFGITAAAHAIYDIIVGVI